jgi:hypothetical protein
MEVCSSITAEATRKGTTANQHMNPMTNRMSNLSLMIRMASCARYARIGIGKTSENERTPSRLTEAMTAGERKIRPGEEDQTGPPRDSPPSPQQTVPSPSRQDGSVEFIVVKDRVGVCERVGYWRLLIDVGLLISDIGCPFVGFGCPFDDVGRLLIRRNPRTRGWRRSCLFVFYC